MIALATWSFYTATGIADDAGTVLRRLERRHFTETTQVPGLQKSTLCPVRMLPGRSMPSSSS